MLKLLSFIKLKENIFWWLKGKVIVKVGVISIFVLKAMYTYARWH